MGDKINIRCTNKEMKSCRNKGRKVRLILIYKWMKISEVA